MNQYLVSKKWLPYWPVFFFVGGFLFDVLTTDRIDEAFGLWMQLGYLLVASAGIGLQLATPSWWKEAPQWLAPIVSFSNEIIHFCLGSLLSVYTIFYFKSSSLLNSSLFLMTLVGLLVANEWPRLQKMEGTLKMALLSMCWTSYFIYVVPILLGSIGWLPFLMGVFLGLLAIWFLFKFTQRTTAPTDWKAIPPQQSHHTKAPLVVAGLFILLYALKILPPVPLALKHIGVYHSVKKDGAHYVLKYEKARWWAFWTDHASPFLARPGDVLSVFVQIFSPTDFKDQLTINWYKKVDSGWSKRDVIPLSITGGRKEGFRGHSYKRNYEPGAWQVRILTSDERELGRVTFKVLPTTDTATRDWTVLIH